MTRFKLYLLLTLCTLLLTPPGAVAAAPPSRSFLMRPVLIPIEVIRSGHIAIRAKINGHGPYRFIFDTGAPSLVISEQVARESRVLPVDFERPFFTPLGNLGNHDVRSIELGRTSQSHLTCDVWNHPTLEILSRAYGRFEGLIGFPFFAHYQVTIDYKSKTMTLVPSVYIPVDTEEKMMDRMTAPAAGKIWSTTESLGIRVTKPANDDTPGVTIAAVLRASPAADAGLKSGDRLLTLDGRWTDSIEDCYAALSAVDTAREVPVVILHNGKQSKVIVKVTPGI